MPLALALAWQEEHVRARGASVAALILRAVAEGTDDGALADLLPADVRFGDHPGLRIMATVHRLALERKALAVAVHLPTMGGTAPRGRPAEEAFAEAVIQSMADHPAALAAGLHRTPQTNEPGRAALLRLALSRLPDRPVRLFEIGTSAGLNLRADHLPGQLGLEAGPLPPIVSRVGCDLDPLDPTTAEGRLTLSSYVWVDDVERFARLAQALQVAARVPAVLVRSDAADFLATVPLQDGTTTVVWHSAFWVYQTREGRARIDAELERLGREASTSRDLVRVTWERDEDAGEEFSLAVTRWTDGTAIREVIATGTSHGAVTSVSG